MEHHPADQLNIEVAHAEHTLASLTDYCKGFRQDLVKYRSLIRETARIGQALLKGCGLSTELIVAQGSDLLFQQLDVGNNRLVALQLVALGSPSRSMNPRRSNGEKPNGPYTGKMQNRSAFKQADEEIRTLDPLLGRDVYH